VTLMERLRWGTVAVLAGTVVLYAADKKDQPKPPSVRQVDSGSFGVFVRGQRVVTETFSVQEDNGVSVVKSKLKETGSSGSSGQKSELEMSDSGELLRYEWSDNSSSLVVVPDNEFLREKITTAASSKPAEKPFLMPNKTAILDNNFFVHREVLAWRYLATDCQTDSGSLKCKQGPMEFGVLVPQDQTSMPVRMELVGREKVTIRGTERELLRLNLKGESFSWALWVDEKDQFKLMRVLIADDNTEVVRD
jgi:hypothetical protein